MQILLSDSQAGPGRKVKQEQEEISRNLVQAFIPGSVYIYHDAKSGDFSSHDAKHRGNVLQGSRHLTTMQVTVT